MKLVILDREGVINRAPDGYVLGPEQFEPLPGSFEAIARLHHAGYIAQRGALNAALTQRPIGLAFEVD